MQTIMSSLDGHERELIIPGRGTQLSALLTLPANAQHIVLFAHPAANCCHSLLNHSLARNIHQQGVATLLVDLVSEDEQDLLQRAEVHYDLMTLAMRLIDVTDWLHTTLDTQNLKISYVGLFEGSTIAVLAAIERPELIHSLILPSSHLETLNFGLRYLQAPTLLISGESDFANILAAQHALPLLPPGSHSVVLARSTTLIEEASLATISEMVCNWLYTNHLKRQGHAHKGPSLAS
jgi:pimeloyl-ACP methyl ester carboxylesterase